MAKCLGITGGIGAGKTTVSNIFQALDIPVFDADAEAKDCYNDPEVISAVSKAFGEDIFIDSILQPKILASRVFAFKDKLRQLEAIIHPKVHNRWMTFAGLHSHHSYIIRENAILIPSQGHLTCDKVLLITAPLEDRISRVMLRSKMSKENILDRISQQWTDEQMLPYCDFVLENKQGLHSKDALIPQIMKIDFEMKNI
jgi:dephospho-CoA kinase